MPPFRPNYDTIGPITRSVRDAATLLDVIAGYDAKDPVTAYAVGHIPASYATDLQPNALRGVRLGFVRQPMSATTDVSSADYRNVHAVLDAALAEVQALGGQRVDVTIPDVAARVSRAYDGDVFEPEAAIDGYLAQHPNAPYKTLRDIVLSGKILPWRAAGLMGVIGHTTQEAGFADLQRGLEDTRRLVLGLMAQHNVAALIYATADHSPGLVARDVMTNPKEGDTRIGGNRTLASVLAFPAITVPAGFTTDGMPVGLEFMGRAFDDAMLLQLAYSYEQATHHRKPPRATP